MSASAVIQDLLPEVSVPPCRKHRTMTAPLHPCRLALLAILLLALVTIPSTAFGGGGGGSREECDEGEYLGRFLIYERCYTCPANSYQDQDDHRSTRCKFCPAGKYNSPIYYTSQANSINDCKTCPFGQTSNGDRSNCYNCPVGKVGAEGGTCVDCFGNSYADETGLASCKDCSTGGFVVVENSNGLNVGCEMCDIGTYQSGNDHTQCLTCPEGKLATSEGATVCYDCDGVIVEQEGQLRCEVCAGRVVDGTCEPCAQNEYLSGTSCVSCPVGHIQSATDASLCVPCAAGTYLAVITEASETTYECKACPGGTYSASSGATQCTAVSAGYVASADQTSQIACGLGMYSSGGTDTCHSCPAGSICGAQACSTCTACTLGTSYTNDEHIQCLTASSCAKGSYITAAATTSSDRECDFCPANTYSDTRNAPSCTSCPTDTISGEGAQECYTSATACQPGEFYSQEASGCEDCPAGSYTSGAGRTSCDSYDNCLAGQYVTATPTPTSNRACAVCPAGKYSDSLNAASCTICDASIEYCPFAATAEPTAQPAPCAAGSYQAVGPTSSTARTCVACSVERSEYQPNGGADSCLTLSTCAPGQYVTTFATSSTDRACSSCAAGFTATTNTATQCNTWTTCRAGEVQTMPPTITSDRVCTTCASGTFAANATYCQPWSDCPAGSYVNYAPSTYQDRICRSCTVGTFSTTANAATCTPVTPTCNVTVSWEVLGASLTNDRICQPVDVCNPTGNNTELCTCPGEGTCSQCSYQGDYNGYLLSSIDQMPNAATSSDQPSECVSLTGTGSTSDQCAALCEASSDCVAFFLYDTATDDGQCCLKASFDTGVMQSRIGGSFFQLLACDSCISGYISEGLGCTAASLAPNFTVAVETLSLNMKVAEGTVLTHFVATPRSSTNESLSITYAISAVSDSAFASAFALNSTTGELLLASSVDGSPSVFTLTIQAKDNRTECRLDEVQQTAGGCVTTKTVQVAVVGFAGCPAITRMTSYLGERQSVTVDVGTIALPPTISNLFSVEVTQPPSYTLAAGDYQVTYSVVEAMDVGAQPTCAFTISIVQGFELTASLIAHTFSTTTRKAADYIAEKSPRVDGELILSSFTVTTNLLDNDFAFGIAGPNQPFSLDLPDELSAALRLSLVWCSEGTMPSSGYNLLPAEVSLNGATSELTFTDGGSGYTDDLACFRVQATSQTFTGRMSWTTIDVNMPFSSNNPNAVPEPTRRRRALTTYFPADGSSVSMQYNSTDAGIFTEEPGPYLTLSDIIPPYFLGCPANQYATALAPNYTVAVTWTEPIAFDNVALDEATLQRSHAPGDYFSVLNSPHTVTYDIRDEAALAAETCSFRIYVSYEEDPVTGLAADMVAQPRGVIVDMPQYDPSVVEKVALLDATAQRLPFSSNLGTKTGLHFDINTKGSDPIMIRQTETLQAYFFRFDLTWNSASGAPTASGATATFELVNEDGSEISCPELQGVQPLRGSTIRIDPNSGAIVFQASSLTYDCAVDFDTITVNLDWPAVDLGTSQTHVYQLTTTSSVDIILLHDGTELEVEDGLRAAVMFDDIPPSIRSCPTSTSFSAVQNTNYGIRSWTLPVFSDARGVRFLRRFGRFGSSGPWVELVDGVNADVSGRSVPFSVGSTTDQVQLTLELATAPAFNILYEVEDWFGLTSNCSSSLRVIDTQAPDLTLQVMNTYNLSANSATVTVDRDDFILDMQDNANLGVSVVEPQPTFDLGVGVHSVTVRVLDAWARQATGTVVINVEDHVGPTIRCFAPNLVETKTGTTRVVNYTRAEASDNDAVANLTCSHEPGDSYPIGRTAVVCNATDMSGNLNSCEFVVVVDEIAVQESRNGTLASASNASSTMTIGVAGAVAFCLVLVIVFLVLRARSHARRPADWNSVFNMIEQLKNGDDVRIPRELKRANLTMLEELGRGAFGLVYKALFEESPNPGFLVAVKSLHHTAGVSDRQELLEEAAVMVQLDHPNVVKLVGVVTVGEPLLVVLEYCEKGSLKSYLENNPDVSESQKIRFCKQISLGMEHIHEKNFVHRDLAARNVLLDALMRCRIADFGLAREENDGADAYYRSRSGNLPVRWTAPEALDERKFSESTDVWAAGILFYEIYTKAGLPYDGWSNQRVWVEVSAGYRLPCPESCSKAVYDLMLACWDETPGFRPSFGKLAEQLSDLITDDVEGGYLRISDADSQGTSAQGSELYDNGGQAETRLQQVTSRVVTKDDVGQRVYVEGYNTMGTLMFYGPHQSKAGLRAGVVLDKPIGNNDGTVGGHKYFDCQSGHGVLVNVSKVSLAEPLQPEGEDFAAHYDMGNGEDEVDTTENFSDAHALYDMGQSENVIEEDESEEPPSGFSTLDSTQLDTAQATIGTDAPALQINQMFEESALEGLTAFGFDEPDDVQMHQRESVPTHPSSTADVGRRVLVEGYGEGVLKYFGPHMTKRGLRCGVALDEAIGNNNGFIGDHAYFTCPDKCGVLVIPTKVTLL